MNVFLKKKIIAFFPIIGLVLGAVAIATEFRKPMIGDYSFVVRVPDCQTFAETVVYDTFYTFDPIICAR